MNKFQEGKSLRVYKYIAPGLILYLTAMVVPLFICLGISFTNWRGGKKMDFVGNDNYIRLLQDKAFWGAFLNNLEIIAILIIAQIGLGFILALLYQSKKIRAREFHRRLIFLPAVLAPMVVGMLWQLVYRNDIGIISSVLQLLGMEGNLPWLNSTSWVIPSICLTLTWQYVGQFVIIIMSGMQNISVDVTEAAQIDGASRLQCALHITFPLLRPTIAVCLLICISGCMKLFDIIFIMSGGGPGRASMVTALYSYDVAFETQRIGYASATAIGMTVLSLGLIAVSTFILGGRKNEKN